MAHAHFSSEGCAGGTGSDGATLAVLGGPLDTGEPGAMRWAGGGNLAGFRAFATDLAGRGGGGLRGEAGAEV